MANYDIGWDPSGVTTSVGTTTGGTATTLGGGVSTARSMPQYSVSESQISELAREHLSTALRPLRRGLTQALTQAQLAGTAPLSRYYMESALRAFSSGIGGAVQEARDYGRTLATEEAQTEYEAAVQVLLKEMGMQTPETPTEHIPLSTTGTTTKPEDEEPTAFGDIGYYPGPGHSRYYAPGYWNIGASGFAKGGPVTKRKPYIVGEEGPELFVPKQTGTIIPNPATQERMKKSHFIPRQYGGQVKPIKDVLSTIKRLDKSLFIPRQYGGAVSPSGDELSSISKGFLDKPGLLGTPEIGVGSSPSTMTSWYQNLLKQRRTQTPIRTLI